MIQTTSLMKANSRLPRKAFPERKGSVFYFDGSSHLPLMDVIVELTREITATPITMDEAAYPHQPSVLVIDPRGFDAYLSTVRARAKRAEAVPETSGNLRKTYSRKWHQSDKFTHNDFLRSLWLMEPVGFYFLQVPTNAPEVVVARVLEMARRYFDIILTLDGRFYKCDPSQLRRFYISCEFRSLESCSCHAPEMDEDSYTLITCTDSATVVSSLPGSLRLMAKSFTGGNIHLLDGALPRVLVRDIVRNMLGVKPKEEVVEKFIKPRRSKRKPVSSSSVLLGSVGIGIPVALANLYLFPEVFLPTYNEIGLVLLFLAGPLGTGALGTFSFMAKDSFKTSDALLKKGPPGLLPPFVYPERLASVGSAPSVSRPAIGPNAASDGSTTSTRATAQSLQASEVFVLPVEAVVKRHDAVLATWLEYETDPIKLLETPLLSDPSCPQTQAFYKATREAEQWADVVKKDGGYQDKYVAAVRELEDAFEIAEAHAKKMGLSVLTGPQRKKVKGAAPFVQVAQNESAAPTERINAWRKATEMLEGIMTLPDKAVVGLLETR